jgi:hypothetical protein
MFTPAESINEGPKQYGRVNVMEIPHLWTFNSQGAGDHVVFQRYDLYYSEGNMRLYIQREEQVDFQSNQLGSSYRYLGIISDGSAWFLICTSLISQQ